MNDKKFYFSKSTEVSANLFSFSMFFFSFFYVVRLLRLSLLNNIPWDILHLYNIVTPIINSVTFVNLKKAGMTSRNVVLKKQYMLLSSFAVVFGILVFAHPLTNVSNLREASCPLHNYIERCIKKAPFSKK